MTSSPSSVTQRSLPAPLIGLLWPDRRQGSSKRQTTRRRREEGGVQARTGGSGSSIARLLTRALPIPVRWCGHDPGSGRSARSLPLALGLSLLVAGGGRLGGAGCGCGGGAGSAGLLDEHPGEHVRMDVAENLERARVVEGDGISVRRHEVVVHHLIRV